MPQPTTAIIGAGVSGTSLSLWLQTSSLVARHRASASGWQRWPQAMVEIVRSLGELPASRLSGNGPRENRIVYQTVNRSK
jgi:hypothetical protein